MAVSVLQRPVSFIFPETEIAATFGDFFGTVSINKTAHGFQSGSALYIKSIIGEYNGQWFVNAVDVNFFRITRDQAGLTNFQSYISGTGGVSLTYRGEAVMSGVTWNCVHLPIFYKLSNTLWPVNSVDTVRTISSATTSAAGYTSLSLSGDIKDTGSAANLEFVKISNASDSDYNGVYQIISYTNDTTFTIDLLFSTEADTAITGASIQYYYNNYHVKVEVWGGLNNGHVYYAQEPYSLLATLDIIPDENNQVKFSISEILKQNIEVKNNLLLGTLPNNLDAFTMFFIKYAEVYDDSDGTTLSQTTPSYTSDLSNFEGRAVNAMLPFKNVYSGVLSEYASEDSSQKFLTDFDEPTIFSGKYFDLSLLWDGVNSVFLKIEKYLNNTLQQTTFGDNVDAFYSGVYRCQIEYSGDCDDYDRMDITAYKTTGIPNPSNWTDGGVAPGSYDSKTSTSFIKSFTTTTFQVGAWTPMSAEVNDLVRVNIVFAVSGTWSGEIALTILLTDINSSRSEVVEITGATNGIVSSNGTYNIDTYLRCITGSANRLQIVVTESLISGTADVTLSPENIVYVIQSSKVISETKTLNIDCTCTRSKATGYYLSWLNYLGGFDYWYFKDYSDEIIDVVEVGETEENIFQNWPNSYGEFADTRRKQTYRKSREQRLLRASNLTTDQVRAISKIRTSPLVQIVNSIYDRRTVIVDSDSFTSLKEGNNLNEISFTITYTDDVPSQKV